jgi:hypothetical protein
MTEPVVFTFAEVFSQGQHIDSYEGTISFLDLTNFTITKHGASQEVKSVSISKSDDDCIVVVSDKIEGSFGKHEDFPLNYCYFTLLMKVASHSISMEFGTKFTYGYNHENSYIDLVSNTLISNELYNKCKADFAKIFGDSFGISQFFSSLYASVDSQTAKKYCDELFKMAVLQRKDKPIKAECDTSYNCLVVHHSNKPYGIEHILVRSILEHAGHFVMFADIAEDQPLPGDDLEAFDMYIVLSNEVSPDMSKLPSHLATIAVPLGFYSAGGKLLRNLQAMFDKCKESSRPDRKKELEESFKQMKANTEGGGCSSGGCGKENCCQNNTEEVISKKDCEKKAGGCGVSNCCSKEETNFFDDFIEEQRKVEEPQVQIEEQVETKSQSGCCNPSSEGTCCKVKEPAPEVPKKKCCGGKCKKE